MRQQMQGPGIESRQVARLARQRARVRIAAAIEGARRRPFESIHFGNNRMNPAAAPRGFR
jgi:hypothetical protein